MANDVIQKQLKAGIDAAKAGNKTEARQLLEQVLEKDENNETAWMWMAMVVDTPRDKRVCLEQVLEINPNNQRARQALERLQPGATTAKPTAAPAPTTSRSIPRPEPEELRPTGTTAARPRRETRMPSAQRRQSRLLTPPFLLGIAAAVGMILVGLFLLAGAAPDTVSTPTLDPATLTAQVGVAAKPTVAGTLPPLEAPANATLVTLEAPQPLPTVTPSPSFTPAVETSPAPTLPAVSSYTIAFVGEGRSGAKQAIYTVKGDGSGEKRLISEGSATSDFAFSSDKHIAYVSESDSGPQLFVASADGGNAKSITDLHGKYLGHPSWSPDASRITFASDDSGNSEIYIIQADGSGLTRITDNKVDDRDPAWSPNNDLIVYASDPTGKQFLQLFEYNLSTKKARQITESAGNNYSPAWSPDGSRIAFISTRDRSPAIYVMDMRGTVRSPLLISYSNLNASYRDPNWSPDSRYILFSSDQDGGNIYNLYMMTPDGKTVTKITDNKEQNRNNYHGWVIQ